MIIKWLENRGIKVNNVQLIQQAFMHSSYVNEHRSYKDNERLEFIGDAVLELWTSEKLFKLRPEMDEGQMTTFRAQLVCEKTLALYARQLGLQEFLKLGSGEEKNGGRQRDSIVSDMFEAFLGALYLDQGMKCVSQILDEVILDKIKNNDNTLFIDYKTKLQEYVQSDTRKTVVYDLINVSGPSNNPKFEMVVKLDGIILGKGIGRSKKRAEQKAAEIALDKLQR